MRKILFYTVVLAACACAGQEEGGMLVKEGAPATWHFRVGPVMSPRARARIHMPRTVPAPPANYGAGESGGTGAAAPADPSAGYTDRIYADGYVKPDEGTDDPDSIVSGLTWNWAADDVGAQYSGGRMEFRTEATRWSESYSSSSFSGGSRSEHDRDMLTGVEATGGWTFFAGSVFDASLDGGFRFYGSGDLSARTRYGTSVSTTRSEYRYVDSYDASGWTTVPSGSHEGTPGGPGPVIGATPERREESMGSTYSSESTYRRAKTHLDYRIWDIRMGPTLGWKANSWLTVNGGVYGLVGLVDATLKTSVDSSQGSHDARKSKCDAVFGMAAGLSAQIDITDSLFLTGGAEYDWWSDAVSLEAGGAEGRIKLSDFTLSLALGIEF